MRPLNPKVLNCTFCKPHRGCNAKKYTNPCIKNITRKDKRHRPKSYKLVKEN